MDQDEGLMAVDNIVTQFNTYEDFLDSQITTIDLYYLEDESLARQLVELGYRGTGEIVKREDFEARKAAIDIARLAERTQKKTLTSAGKDLQDDFLKALAMREEDNRNGKVSTVIFIRDKNVHGQEVSGYIDYAHRLKTEDFEVYFSGKRRLLPRPTDLSFYNWDNHIAVCNSSPNYQVMADNPEGLLFKYKRDRKILNVDPKVPMHLLGNMGSGTRKGDIGCIAKELLSSAISCRGNATPFFITNEEMKTLWGHIYEESLRRMNSVKGLPSSSTSGVRRQDGSR